MNFFSTTISFILQSTITQITPEIAYPISVDNEAPSIPKTGIKKKFIAILVIAPTDKMNQFGQVFLTTRN